MAIRNPQIAERTANIRQSVENLRDEIGRASDDLRRIVGPEYDNYTPSQKQFAEELYDRRNLFFKPDGKPRRTVFGNENRRFANETFDDKLLGEMIRDGAPLYLTPGTVAEGTVNRELREQAERDSRVETRPAPDTYYERQREEAEKNLPSEVDDFSGYAEGMNRLETELDPTSPNFRQGLNEGGTAEDPVAKNFFVSQRAYTPEEYEGYVNFFQGSLGSGISVSDDDGDDEDDGDGADETTASVLNPVKADDPTEKAPPTTVYSMMYGQKPAYSVEAFSYGDGLSDFDVDFNKFATAGSKDLSDSVVSEFANQVRQGANVKTETALAPLNTALNPALAATAGTLMGKQVPAAFGKDTTYRPSGLPGFGLDLAMAFHNKNAAAVGAAGGKAGALMLVNGMMVSRAPGKVTYTGNLGGLTAEQMYMLETAKEGFVAGTMRDVYDEETKTWSKQGMKGLLDSKTALAVGGNVSETGFFISNFGGGAKLTGAAGMRNKEYAAAYMAAFEKYGVSQAQFKAALLEAQSKTGAFGTVRGKYRNVTFLSDALTRMRNENIAAKEGAAREDAAQQQMRDLQRDAGQAADAAARRNREENEDGDPVNTGNEYNFDSSQSFGVGAGGGMSGALAKGGRVGLQEGGEAMAPAGFVAGPPSEFTDRQKVADDQNMQVEEGTFVINAAAVEEAGSEDIKNMILKAYSVAREQGVFEVDRPLYEKAVDVAVSKGEVIVPPQLARIIGYDRLRKINNRGKKETQERIEETGQNPQGGFLGGVFGKKKDEDLVETFIPPSKEELNARHREAAAMPIQEKGREVPDEGFVAPITSTASTPLPKLTEYEEIVRSALQVAEDNKTKGYVPPSPNSGVTIGRGFDIGNHSITDLEKMGLDTDMLAKLTPYVGKFVKKNGKRVFVRKSGAAAREALKRDPLTITDQRVLEELNITVQRKKHEEFESFVKRYNIPMPTNPADKAVMFTEYYVGAFVTKDGRGTNKSFYNKKANKHVTIRDSFLKAFNGGNAYDALYDGIIVPLRGDTSDAAERTRNRANRMIKWWSENSEFPTVTEPMAMPVSKPAKPPKVLPTPKPKRNSSATRGIRP